MSRLNDLIRQVGTLNGTLAADLQLEVSALADRRSFGLNFERHVPETVELPGRPVRKGDKVRVLPPRGETAKQSDDRLWRVLKIRKTGALATAELVDLNDETASITSDVGDLVVVAEFRDPIYPGLVSTGKVERGGDKPFHTVINAENYHALQTLLFTHRGKVDCIYIDPPYNSGAKDWKYNNDYVESEDLYRHSKWLAFMEKRLVLAKHLLNPDDSVLIVSIDEKEYLRIGLLLEQIFPEWRIQMISSVINPRGIVRANEFSRSNEFIFFVWAEGTKIAPSVIENTMGTPVAWETMRRRSVAGARGKKGPGACGPNQFFAIHVNAETGYIEGRGEPLKLEGKVADYEAPPGCVAVFPSREDGMEMNWSLTDGAFDHRWSKGFVRAGKATLDKPQQYLIQYVLGGVIEDIEQGRISVTGHAADGSVIAEYVEKKTIMAHTQWDISSHNAQQNGTGLLSLILPDRRFPYAKSLYAVEDALRFFVSNKPSAVVLDFFAGSGTSAHAVMRLNRQDNGFRKSISITNNEVSADEHKLLRDQNLRPGDGQWEEHGICEYITKPRIEAVINGKTPAGELIKGDYKYTDQFPLCEGFEANVEFFTLTYEAPLRVASNRDFSRIAPLLWIRTGSQGRRIDDISSGWDVTETYGVIVDLDQVDAFVDGVNKSTGLTMVFIMTNDDRLFESVVRSLPGHVEPVRLYESYLRNFEIESGRSTR